MDFKIKKLPTAHLACEENGQEAYPQSLLMKNVKILSDRSDQNSDQTNRLTIPIIGSLPNLLNHTVYGDSLCEKGYKTNV